MSSTGGPQPPTNACPRKQGNLIHARSHTLVSTRLDGGGGDLARNARGVVLSIRTNPNSEASATRKCVNPMAGEPGDTQRYPNPPAPRRTARSGYVRSVWAGLIPKMRAQNRPTQLFPAPRPRMRSGAVFLVASEQPTASVPHRDHVTKRRQAAEQQRGRHAHAFPEFGATPGLRACGWNQSAARGSNM